MVNQQHITDAEELHLQAVHCQQHNQSWFASKNDKQIAAIECRSASG